MKQYLYGKRMLVVDLLIVSLWAMFGWHAVGCDLVMSAMIIMRISLAFELFRKSRWATMTAVMFAIIYVSCVFSMPSPKYVDGPIDKMMYTVHYLCWHSQFVFEGYDMYAPEVSQWARWIIWAAVGLWLVLMPVILSLWTNGCARILARRRRLWWYMAFILAVTAFFLFAAPEMAYFFFAMLMALMPVAYWMLYSRRKRWILERLLRDKILMGYVGIAAVFYIAYLIGMYDIAEAKSFAAIALPVALYIVACRLAKATISAIPALLIGLGGFAFVNCYNRPHEFVIACLCIGMALTIVGNALAIRYMRKILAPVLLFIATGFALPLLLLGYNPYSLLKADYVFLLNAYDSDVPNGLYEFSVNGFLGARDRYGVIIPASYSNMYFLEGTDDYMVVALDEINSPYYELKVFDLQTNEFVKFIYEYPVAKIEMIGYHKYAMYDASGEQVYTLVLEYEDGRPDAPCVIRCKYEGDEYAPRNEFSSNLKEAEEQLLEIYDQYGGFLGNKLMDLLQADANTLYYPFDKLQQEINIKIATSEDNKARVYSWDTGEGGTSPYYSSFIQYATRDTVLTDYFYPVYDSKYVFDLDLRKDGIEAYEGSYCEKIYQVPLTGGKNAYLITAYNRDSSTEGEQECILVYEKDGRLEKLPFIDKNGEEQLSAETYYLIPDWYYTTDGLGWDWVMAFDSETNTIYVPESGDMEMSDRYDLYRYDNGQMAYAGNDAGYWLHPSLRKFKRLAGIYQTDTKLIRIDQLKGLTYRYAAWPKSQPMSAEPELVMYSDKVNDADNSITFTNGDYTYIVPLFRKGIAADFGKVIIKHHDETISETEV